MVGHVLHQPGVGGRDVEVSAHIDCAAKGGGGGCSETGEAGAGDEFLDEGSQCIIGGDVARGDGLGSLDFEGCE